MASSGDLRSKLLKDFEDTEDSLKRMIREVKRGSRRLTSKMNAVNRMNDSLRRMNDSLRRMIREVKRRSRRQTSKTNAVQRKLEELKRIWDELNELSPDSDISSYTDIEMTEPETNTNEMFLSLEEDLIELQNENIDLMDNDDENTVLPISGIEINTWINSSDIPEESLPSPVGSFPSMKSFPSMESFDRTVEIIDSTVERFDSSMDYTDFSEDEFLDADDDIDDIFGHSSTHWCVEGSVLEDTQEPVSTISTTGENSQSFDREKTNCKEEHVISVCTNEYKKRILSVPTNINIFENVQDRNKINISNAALTNENYERLEREEVEDLKRKSSRTSSISSNTNFSGDSSKIIEWPIVDPIEHDFNDTVTEENSKSPEREQFNDKEENDLEINSYPETNFSKDPFMSFLPKTKIIQEFTNGMKTKTEDENELNSFSEISSDFSTDGLSHTAESVPHFGDKNTLIGSLDTSSLSEIISNCPSQEDVSVHLNAVKRPSEDSVASTSEKPEPTKMNLVNNILNKDKAE